MQGFVRENHSLKWHKHSSEDYPLTFADMDLPLDPALKAALIGKLQLTNNFTYKVRPKQYFEAIVRWYSQRHLREGAPSLKAEHILESPSVINMLYIAI
jgi:bifunctional pyridoxal-dependent enzyme with beta-cystathionase and maltose regulon repressor activities